MNKCDFGVRLRKTLPRWLGWAAACGSLSLTCALIFGVGGGVALGAMALGILTWSGICAAITASEAYAMRAACGDWDRSLGRALWVRAGGTLLGAGMMGAGLRIPWVAGMNWLILPDFWAGMVSIQLGHKLLGGFWTMAGEVPEGFMRTYVTTLVQGAWIVFSIIVLTAVIHVWRRRGIVPGE